MDANRCVGIVGCGDMGFALANRLSLYGFTIVMGSRYPEKHAHRQFQVVSTVECIRRSSVIFLAVHPEHYNDSLSSHLEHQTSLLYEKILIDLSNELPRKSHQDQLSNAERLQIAISRAFVVKAFNTISSFAMQNTATGESPNVFIASDHLEAKDKVIAIAREINFQPLNVGSLRAARHLENHTRLLFPQWRIPLIITFFTISFWLSYTLCMNYIHTHETSWNQLYLHMTNQLLCPSAITMLAIVYMPSNVACIFQLVYRTRDRRFPIWLDKWLLSRKQLGLVAFVIALFHTIISIILVSPDYYSSWFHSREVSLSNMNNQTRFIVRSSLMTAKGELAALLGILTLLSMSILAITSIPGIGNQLNWREWRFIQSRIGIVTLLLALGHVLVMAIPFWIKVGLVKSLFSIDVLCMFFPIITILLKFIFWLPCFSRPLYRIRRGQVLNNVIRPNRNA